ncbi:MAG TPA: NAD(P)-binding oxidoreductase [Ktedonobacterales bacterium]|nr:NAD(P)-binding oxidoreductase [Ktedonobacterales bacterium]
MNITVFGASGGIGQHFIELATARDHTIRAVYRTMPQVSHVSRGSQVEILVNPDIFNPDFVARAIRDADVVVTTLGPTFVKRHNAMTKMISPPDIHQRLAGALVRAMSDAGAPTKVISVSTGSMGPGDAVMGLGPRMLLGVFRTFVARNLRRVGRDLGAMEQVLAAGGLDWYAVRPIKLTDGPLTMHVQASDRFVMKSISRADVAWYLLTLAEDPKPRLLRTPILVPAPGSLARQSEKELAAGRMS